jgi:hypothetical protein
MTTWLQAVRVQVRLKTQRGPTLSPVLLIFTLACVQFIQQSCGHFTIHF